MISCLESKLYPRGTTHRNFIRGGLAPRRFNPLSILYTIFERKYILFTYQVCIYAHMHCLLHLNESLNLEDFLSLSHLQNASVGPFWSFIVRNDRFPILSYASNNEIPIFLKPVKGTPLLSPPRISAQRNNLLQQETRDRMVDILLCFSLQK